MQHELTPRVGLAAGYYRRDDGNRTGGRQHAGHQRRLHRAVLHHRPSNADLPGGGGYPICGLYDITPTARGLQQNYTTFASNFGESINRYQGVDVSANVRLAGGTFINTGFNMQQRLLDDCAANRIDSPEAQFCRQLTPFRPDFKISASHTLPWAAADERSLPALARAADHGDLECAEQRDFPALGRNLAAGATSTKSIELIEPGTLFSENHTQLDLGCRAVSRSADSASAATPRSTTCSTPIG